MASVLDVVQMIGNCKCHRHRHLTDPGQHHIKRGNKTVEQDSNALRIRILLTCCNVDYCFSIRPSNSDGSDQSINQSKHISASESEARVLFSYTVSS